MKNVHYINAGAGAGKTYTLVSILEKILTDTNKSCSPSEIILTTYTKAAAKEFRKKTFERLLKNPNGLNAAKILDTATIGTVHSVAEQYIKRYWTLLGYSGQFNIMTEIDKTHYINQSLKNIVNPDDLSFFYEYTQGYNLMKKDAKTGAYKTNYDFWKDYVLAIVSKMQAYDIEHTKLKDFCSQSCEVVDRLFETKYDNIRLKKKAQDCVDDLKSKSLGTKKDGTPTENAKKAKDKLSIYDTFQAKTSPSLKEISTFLESDFFPKNLDKSQKATKSYLDLFLFLTVDNCKKVKECIACIFDIADKWYQTYEEYKRQNNLLDFDDLEAKFLELLQCHEVQEDIKSSIKYLFVDEFQDSNPIQLEIFKKLSELVQEKCYWVGDRKQAIYGFRGSDSSLITDLLSLFPSPVPGQTENFMPNNSGCTSQLLDISYRSIKSLVELSNDVFAKSFATGDKTEIINNVPLKVYRVQPKKDDGKIEKPIQHWHCDSEDALANKVAEILNGKATEFPGVYDDDGEWHDKIVPSDIAVLSRTGADCDNVAEALRKKGIPVSSPETSILDKAEVRLVFALLKYVAGIKRRYAKAELAKLLEDKEIGTILVEVKENRYDYNPFFDLDKNDDESEATTTEDKHEKKDPDAFFANINDKLQGLRGLNISAMVKGVIAVMDLRNVVAKWGNVPIRQDNLDTLIEQAIAFEQSTAKTTNSATVADFIRYMEEIKLEAELDQSAEGVKVATYHKSKGLQWPIVILNSLDKNELDDSDFVKKNWFQLNLKGNYGSAELQLIPECVSVDDSVAEAVEELSKAGAGKDDNGYYDMRHGKAEGEMKRLLYVGVTRARDYLVTLSYPKVSQGNKNNLFWIKNVRGIGNGGILDDMSNHEENTFIDMWGVPAHPAFYEKIKEGDALYDSVGAEDIKLKEYRVNTETEHKSISPSGSNEKYNATAKLIEDFESAYIEHGAIAKDEYDEFGTCIHNYFAAHRWEGKAKIGSNRPANVALAETTVKNHDKLKELPNPKLLTDAADKLFSYLEGKFGTGELLRECPFTYCRDNGQLVKGEIDLVWKLNNNECILLDYKNFPGDKNGGKKIVLDDKGDNKLYIGKYFPQLGDYRAALIAAGMEKNMHVFIFYAVLGCLVEVKFL